MIYFSFQLYFSKH